VSVLDDKSRLSAIVPELRAGLIDCASTIEAKGPAPSVMARLELLASYRILSIVRILNRFGALWDGLLEANESVLKICWEALGTADVQQVFGDHRELMLSFVEKNSVQLNYLASFELLFGLFGGEAFSIISRLKFKAGDHFAGDRELAQALVQVARTGVAVPWLLENFPTWMPPLIFSRNPHARHDVRVVVVALFPSRKLEDFMSLSSPAVAYAEPPPWIDELSEAHALRGRTILQAILALLPHARDAIASDFPSPGYEMDHIEKYRALDFLDLIRALLRALNHTDPLPEIDTFFREIMPHTQAYDPHVKALLEIASITGIEDDLVFAQIRRVPFDRDDRRHIKRGISCLFLLLPLLKKASTLPYEVADVMTSCFIFTDLPPFADFLKIAVDALVVLVEKNPRATMALVDANTADFARVSISWLAMILELAHEQRPILKYWRTGLWHSGFTNSAKLITTLMAVHTTGLDVPPTNQILDVIDHPEAPKEARKAAWELLRVAQVSASLIFRRTCVTAFSLERKARLALQLPPEDRDRCLLLLSLNSFRALDVALPVIREKLVSEDIAEPILKGSLNPRHACWTWTADDTKKLTSIWGVLTKKKIHAAPVIRYGKAVAEAIGQEKLAEFFAWFPRSVGRKLEYVVAVLASPKEGALEAKELDHFIDDFEIIRELRLTIDRLAVEKLVAALENPEIVTVLRYEGAPAVAAAAKTLL
jgi:hypothetical protein